MFQGFKPEQPHTADTGIPIRPPRPVLLSKSQGKKDKHKKRKHVGQQPSYAEQLLALAIQELGASNRMMAAALSEIARAKEIPPAPVEVTDFYVDGEEGDGQ